MRIEHVTCAGCGCDCDDIEVVAEGGRIVSLANACALGRAWFLGDRNEGGKCGALPAAVRIGGEEARLDDGIDVAARILSGARYPLVYGLCRTSCEAQRVAVTLAETMRGCIDSGSRFAPWTMAVQASGAPTCTLGEVKHSADLIVYWGSDPAQSHPRHMERYTGAPSAAFPGGRSGRTIVVVGDRRRLSAESADLFVEVAPGGDFDALWTLQARVNGESPEPGLLSDELKDLSVRMRECRFGVLFVGGGIMETTAGQCNAQAISLLAETLNRHTKFAVIPMRDHGNEAGLESVMTWRTGFPFGVDFSAGAPRFNPGEWTAADVLARDEADAALIVGSRSAASFPEQAMRRLSGIPTIALGDCDPAMARNARVAFAAATAGIHAEGAVHRMDGVSVPLAKVLDSPFLSDEELLLRLLMRVRELRRC